MQFKLPILTNSLTTVSFTTVSCISMMLRTLGRISRRPSVGIRKFPRRLLTTEPKEVFTKINDSADPARSQFFQYSWGSWIKNNKVEKARRETRFSIEGVTKFMKDLKIHDSTVVKPLQLKNGVTILPHNFSSEIIGNEAHDVVSIASIHEGKHHRVYKITLGNGKQFVLRIPYKHNSDFAIEQTIKSEVATMDFLLLKMKQNVPKVLAYGVSRNNVLNTPFILMEYIEGDLLMKKWNPVQPDSESSEQDLKLVIDPILEFQVNALELTFNRFGSLYFLDDVSAENQAVVPYEGELDPSFVDRWRIGPSTERSFSRGKKHLSSKQINELNGPWDSLKPLQMIQDLAKLELESLKARLALSQADAGSKIEDVDGLHKQIQTFEHLYEIAPKLFNTKSTSIMNADEMFKPRFFFPDLDPLNVIVEKETKKNYFVDLEHTSIKPFLLSGYPAFIGYQGAKIYNLEDDIPGYAEMDEVEKQQYQFMYYKTRNERLWEIALNERRHDLIAIASPHIKVLKAPYLQALEKRNDRDHLFVENSIVQLQAMWSVYVANGLVDTLILKFPTEYSQSLLDEHQADLEDYQLETASKPFAATGGWIPQDMFDVLEKQGILVADEHGNYEVQKDAALREEKL